MSEREIVIRLRIPEKPRKRWLVLGALAIVCFSAIAYAGLTVFKSGDSLSSQVMNDNFTYMMPVVAPRTVLSPLNVAASTTPMTVTGAGHQVTIMPSGGKGVFVVQLSGQWAVSAAGVAAIQLVDVTTTKTSGTLGNSGGSAGNSTATLSGSYSTCALTWIEPVAESTAQPHTFGIQISSTVASNIYGDLTVMWFPQP